MQLLVQYNSITADYPPSQRLPVWRHINIGTVGKQNSRLNPENRDYGQPFGNNFTLILQNCVVYQRLMPVFIHTWKMNQHEKMCLCTIHKKAHIKKQKRSHVTSLFCQINWNLPKRVIQTFHSRILAGIVYTSCLWLS